MGTNVKTGGASLPRTIGISGASGFIGSHLSAFLSALGHRIVPLPRPLFSDGAEGKLAQAVAQCDAVVNLAGAPIDRRWTPAYKKELYDSRIATTRKLVAAIDRSPRVKLLHSTSAVGFYPSTDHIPETFGRDVPHVPDSACFDETWAMSGTGFLAGLCQAWETEARKVNPQVRLVISRFGVVLDKDGGAFPLLSLPARLKVSVALGPGSQPFPWIDLRDLARAVAFILEHNQLDGVFNFVAPGLVTQRELSLLLARHYRSWLRVTAPRWTLRLLKGESADFLSSGQCVLPDRLLRAGFTFESPRIETFLSRL